MPVYKVRTNAEDRVAQEVYVSAAVALETLNNAVRLSVYNEDVPVTDLTNLWQMSDLRVRGRYPEVVAGVPTGATYITELGFVEEGSPTSSVTIDEPSNPTSERAVLTFDGTSQGYLTTAALVSTVQTTPLLRVEQAVTYAAGHGTFTSRINQWPATYGASLLQVGASPGASTERSGTANLPVYWRSDDTPTGGVEVVPFTYQDQTSPAWTRAAVRQRHPLDPRWVGARVSKCLVLCENAPADLSVTLVKAVIPYPGSVPRQASGKPGGFPSPMVLPPVNWAGGVAVPIPKAFGQAILDGTVDAVLLTATGEAVAAPAVQFILEAVIT